MVRTAAAQAFQPPAQVAPGSTSLLAALRWISAMNSAAVVIASPSTPGSDCAREATPQ